MRSSPCFRRLYLFARVSAGAKNPVKCKRAYLRHPTASFLRARSHVHKRIDARKETDTRDRPYSILMR